MIGALRPNSKVAIVTNTILSPSLQSAIADFGNTYGETQVVTYDPVSSAALILANQQQFGLKAVPSYHFDKADVVVSFGADFLGTWISPVEFAADYIKNRKIEDAHHAKMSRHYQIESRMSLTGSNADNRILIKPSEQGAAIAQLFNSVASKLGGGAVTAPGINGDAQAAIDIVASDLVASQGKSLVVSDSNVVAEQLLVNAINELLGNYGETLDMSKPCYLRQGNEQDIASLITQMSEGRVDLLLVHDWQSCIRIAEWR